MLEFQVYASGSTGNLYSLTDGQTTVVIECGLPWKEVQKAFQYKTHAVEGVCLSHQHLDHSKAVSDAAKAGLDVYMLKETREALGISGPRIHEIEPLKQFTIGSFQVVPFLLEHDVPNSGFLFASGGEKMAFLTDTYYCHHRFNGLSIIAVECNYSPELISEDLHPAVRKRLLRSHMSLENCIRLLQANDLSRVREIYLIHISEGNGDLELFRRKVQETTGKPVYIKE